MVNYTSQAVRYTFGELDTMVRIGWGSFSRYPLLNTRLVHSLGVDFLYSKNTEERINIEDYFTKLLLKPEANYDTKFSILAFLKSPDAVVSKAGKGFLIEFENNPVNEEVVTAVNAHLAQD